MKHHIADTRAFQTPTFVIFARPVEMSMPDGPYMTFESTIHRPVQKLRRFWDTVEAHQRKTYRRLGNLEVVHTPMVDHHHAWSIPHGTVPATTRN